MTNPAKPLARPLAAFVTTVAAAMAATAAWDRGGTALDRTLLVALSVAIVAAVHLLPALSRRPATWLLWFGCLLCAMYGHLTFLTHAGLRAGDERTQHAAQVVGTGRQIDATQRALDAITARPVAVVAAQLANTRASRERAALRLELEEARRAEDLRAQLVTLAATQTQAEVTGATDPVVARLAAVTGSNEASISVIVGLVFSLLLELLGTVLWMEALRPAAETSGVEVMPGPPPSLAADDPLADLQAAIAAGKLRPTVSGIRAFLGCSQAKAMEMRRVLLAG